MGSRALAGSREEKEVARRVVARGTVKEGACRMCPSLLLTVLLGVRVPICLMDGGLRLACLCTVYARARFVQTVVLSRICYRIRSARLDRALELFAQCVLPTPHGST